MTWERLFVGRGSSEPECYGVTFRRWFVGGWGRLSARQQSDYHEQEYEEEKHVELAGASHVPPPPMQIHPGRPGFGIPQSASVSARVNGTWRLRWSASASVDRGTGLLSSATSICPPTWVSYSPSNAERDRLRFMNAGGYDDHSMHRMSYPIADA